MLYAFIHDAIFGYILYINFFISHRMIAFVFAFNCVFALPIREISTLNE
jgi:hypothetical protein